MKINCCKNLDIKIIKTNQEDKDIYYQIKKECCKKYVNKYFGGWNNKEQLIYNNNIFEESLLQTCFDKIVVNEKIVGFFGYSIFEKEIGCVTLQIIDIPERKYIFEFLLNTLSTISNKYHLPVFAKTFLDSDDVELYKNAGFEIFSSTKSHYLLKKRS